MKMQYMSFSLKVLLKMITLKKREKAEMEPVLNCVQLCSFILVVLNPQVSLRGYQLSVSEGISKLDILKVKNLMLLIFPQYE